MQALAWSVVILGGCPGRGWLSTEEPAPDRPEHTNAGDTSVPEDSGAPAAVDEDGDGWTVAEGDCDDGDGSVVPVAWTGTDGSWMDLSERFVVATEQAPARLEVAASGSIVFCDGTWYGNIVTREGVQSLSLESRSGADVTLLDAAGGRHLDASTPYDQQIHLEGLTFQNGLAQGEGGSITSYRADLSVADSVFRGNRALDESGGAIRQYEGTVSVSGSHFEDNVAYDRGGAIHLYQGTMSVSGTRFEDNLAYADGGAIDMYQGFLIVEDSTFVHNEAREDGGALYLHCEGGLSLDGSAFEENVAGGQAGAFGARETVDIEVVDTRIVGNVSGADEGAVSLAWDDDEGERLTVTASDFGADASANVPWDIDYGGVLLDVVGVADVSCFAGACE